MPGGSRPQEPTGPLPYATVAVELAKPGTDIRLAGTLTLPPGSGPHPAILLIPGSGKQDRDETVCGHRPFLIWADTLTRAGIATLRLDDRGVGGSSGDKDQATHADLLDDVRFALAHLREHPAIDATRIGALGHSEGGVLAAAVAASSDVSLAVMLGTPGLRGDRVVHAQAEAISRAAGLSGEAIAHERAMNEEVFALVMSERDTRELEPELIEVFRRRLSTWPGGGPTGAELDGAARTMAEVVLTPAFRDFLLADPAPSLRKVGCPVLALIGDRDIQVDSGPNLAAIRSALAASRFPESTVELVPGVNHLFQECRTGTIEEYEEIEETVTPRVLRRVSDWIAARWALPGEMR